MFISIQLISGFTVRASMKARNGKSEKEYCVRETFGTGRKLG